MPLPIVHLAIAFAVHERVERCPTPEFLLGSLAPDAIHMRPGTTRADKRRTHLQNTSAADWPRPLRDWMARHVGHDPTFREFIRGYAAHLLADRLWAGTALQEFRRAAPAELDDGGLKALYYRELDQVDVNLFRTEPWPPCAWSMLATAPAMEAPGLLTANEIDRWRTRTLAWFDDPAHDPGIVPAYLTEERVHIFVGEARDMVIRAGHDWVEW